MSTDSGGTGVRHQRAIRTSDAWKAWLGLGLAMVVGYFLLPSQQIQDIAYQLPGMLAAILVVAGAALAAGNDPGDNGIVLL